MSLSRLQSLIIRNLANLGILQAPQVAALTSITSEVKPDAFDSLLTNDYGVKPFALHITKHKALGIPATSGSRVSGNYNTFERLPKDFCVTNRILPAGVIGEFLIVHTSNDKPWNDFAEDIKRLSNLTPLVVYVPVADLDARFTRVNEGEAHKGGADLKDVMTKLDGEFSSASEESTGHSLMEDEHSGPIVELANRIIEDAYLMGASDIHLSPQEGKLIVRFRVDGSTREHICVPKTAGPALIARIKIMCNLDISERRLPQDGRIVFKQFTKKNMDIDLRVSTAPLNHGEGVVMRILDKQKSTLPLPQLGFSEENLAKYRECIRQPYGMILHCGPTGSGKSMTLYSALGEINTPDMVIRTAEDPIEYTLAGLDQMQMHRQIGLTFASALRAFLRQDPDIILVGEIRDKETAGIAIEAALTGHLLISTLHTNDAPSTVARLTDMGIEPFMISSSLVCVCAQRLLRRVCKKCKVEVTPEGNELAILEQSRVQYPGWNGKVFHHNPNGCPSCGNSGYKGRVGIHELMVSSEELVSAINKEAETATLKDICMRTGMKTLHQDSILKVMMGVTTTEEALANVPVDMELRKKT